MLRAHFQLCAATVVPVCGQLLPLPCNPSPCPLYSSLSAAAPQYAVCCAPVVADDEIGLAAHLSQDLLRGGTDGEANTPGLEGKKVTVQHMCPMRHESRRAGSDSKAVHACSSSSSSLFVGSYHTSLLLSCPRAAQPAQTPPITPHLGCVDGEALQVGPQVEARHPLVQHTPAGGRGVGSNRGRSLRPDA